MSDSLFVKEIFHSIQGEGSFCGFPAIFIRLGKCNLSCSFCDTDFKNPTEMKITNILNMVQDFKNNFKYTNLIVLTGGEPFLQDINTLCKYLVKLGFLVQIETNGTLYKDIPEEVKIICSPKTVNGKYLKINNEIALRAHSFKFLISDNINGYNLVPEWIENYKKPIFIQPIDQNNELLNKKNLDLCYKIAIEKGYRISLQMHKIIKCR